MRLILKAHPRLLGVLFDLPSVIEGAKSLIEAEGVAERCELVAGDFFESVPGGADAYILKFVIHDWDDDRAVTILKNCHRAMVEDGRLLVVEMVIPPGNEPFYGKLTDLNMLVLTGGGRERTEAEYRTLFDIAGFGRVPIGVEKRNGAFFRWRRLTTTIRPPDRATSGGTRHGQGYQEVGASAAD